MSRIMTFGALTFSLFLLGLLAGGGLSSGWMGAGGEPQQLAVSPEIPVPQLPPFDSAEFLFSGGQEVVSADPVTESPFDVSAVQSASFD
ncbi:MAG: hypothetical protein ACKON9_18165, partial [Planctomycetaceae bacterium]